MKPPSLTIASLSGRCHACRFGSSALLDTRDMSTAASAAPATPRILLIQAYCDNSRNLPDVAALLARAAAIGFTVKSTTRSHGYGGGGVTICCGRCRQITSTSAMQPCRRSCSP